MKRISDQEWTCESVLPVSFAPLTGLENNKDRISLIQIGMEDNN